MMLRLSAYRLFSFCRISRWSVACPLFVALLVGPVLLPAQGVKRGTQVKDTLRFPNDSTTIVRKLPNGVTYYIKTNRAPEGIVELRLVVKAGSIHETESQMGAAHLLAQSAMFGVPNLSYDSLRSILYNSSVDPREDSTIQVGYDVTAYRATLNNDSREIETVLSLFADWAKGWTITDAALESARQEALAKLRLAEDQESNALAFTDSVRFAGTAFGTHRPLGLEAGIQLLTKSQLEQFQRTWYRPDNMAIVVVGDVKEAEIEALIKRQFGSIRAPSGKLPKSPVLYGKPVGQQTTVAVFTDTDSSNSWIQILYRREVPPNGLMSSYRWGILNSIFTNIISQRVGELKGRPNSVITRANATLLPNEPDGAVIAFRAGVAQGATVDSALSSLIHEISTVAQHGFTKEELNLWQQLLQGTYNNTNLVLPPDMSSAIAAQYIRHFADGSHFTTQRQQRPFVADILNTMTEDELQNHAKSWLSSSSRVVVVGVGREGGGAPREASLVTLIDNISKQKVAERHIDSTFRMVEVKAGSIGDLSALIKKEIEKAERLGYTPVVEFGATWCIPCRLIDVSMHHPKMREAFDKVYLIRIDVDDWQEAIPNSGFNVTALPSFFAVNRDGRPTGTVKQGVESGQMNPSTGDMNNSFVEAAAPGFKAFFDKCKEEFAKVGE
jgi:zinc protease